MTGNYVDVAINVTGAPDMALGIAFAQSHDIRLVIKNTGHDLLGKSTGTYGLGLWTHYLTAISFEESYAGTNSDLTGAAMKMGAGAQSYAAHEAASPRGLRVVGGTSPTVGIAGGYTRAGAIRC